MNDAQLMLDLDRRRITRSLIVIVAAVTLLHVFWTSTDHLDLTGETLWRHLSNVDVENAFPTWLSAVLLAASAALAGLMDRDERHQGGRFRRHWWFLAVILTVLSVDEVASLHEAISGPISRALGTSGIFFYGWVVPALIAVAVLTITYARFILALPSPVKSRLMLAAALFVGGAALGLEMVAGLIAETEAREGWLYLVTSAIEELLELAGLILLVDTLLLHLSRQVSTIRVGLAVNH